MQVRSVTQKNKTKKVSSSKGSHTTVSSSRGVTSHRTRSVKRSSSTYGKKLKRYAKQGVKSLLLSPAFHSTFKVVSVALFISGLLFSSYFFISKSFANEVVISQSEVISRLAKLTTLPKEAPYEIVRVQDETDLRKQNPFYKDIKEGDYIVIYKDMAIIYDLRNNAVIGIKRTGDR